MRKTNSVSSILLAGFLAFMVILIVVIPGIGALTQEAETTRAPNIPPAATAGRPGSTMQTPDDICWENGRPQIISAGDSYGSKYLSYYDIYGFVVILDYDTPLLDSEGYKHISRVDRIDVGFPCPPQ